MELYLNTTSPYARVVRICAIEKQLDDVKLIWVDPWADDNALLTANPNGKIPVLVTDRGRDFIRIPSHRVILGRAFFDEQLAWCTQLH
ncbi:glutathione S-transferase N-terminal domain-containing protein [Salinivibrio kushneri]|uniref:glutathione S-transferase N-terminal domain-containing protein n=1 Tax=Salinivibrio kushneri TaxID=1908198 RepID=UPI0018E337AB|nr:glutathione S-transferase N-terminal domain-containing protein [Salinivibrio kushneri]